MTNRDEPMWATASRLALRVYAARQGLPEPSDAELDEVIADIGPAVVSSLQASNHARLAVKNAEANASWKVWGPTRRFSEAEFANRMLGQCLEL
jgi:hypothetical protein